jgi:hypothetical protein
MTTVMKLSIKPCLQAAARECQSNDIADFMLRAGAEGKPREQDGGADGQKYRPPHGPKNDVRPPSFAVIFARPTGPGQRAATVAIWPRRPQNRFRPAFAYCEQTPTIQLSLENSIPALICLTQVFSNFGNT